MLSETRQEWKAVLYRISLNVALFLIQIHVLRQDRSMEKSRSNQPDEHGSISGGEKIFTSLASQYSLCDSQSVLCSGRRGHPPVLRAAG
jgi:hypothetical protein